MSKNKLDVIAFFCQFFCKVCFLLHDDREFRLNAVKCHHYKESSMIRLIRIQSCALAYSVWTINHLIAVSMWIIMIFLYGMLWLRFHFIIFDSSIHRAHNLLSAIYCTAWVECERQPFVENVVMMVWFLIYKPLKHYFQVIILQILFCSLVSFERKKKQKNYDLKTKS